MSFWQLGNSVLCLPLDWGVATLLKAERHTSELSLFIQSKGNRKTSKDISILLTPIDVVSPVSIWMLALSAITQEVVQKIQIIRKISPCPRVLIFIGGGRHESAMGIFSC